MGHRQIFAGGIFHQKRELANWFLRYHSPESYCPGLIREGGIPCPGAVR
jgi:hypothetical protein